MTDSTSEPGTGDDEGAGLGKKSEIPEESVSSESDLALDKQAERIHGKDE